MTMKVRRKIIQIDEDLCDGCGQCVPSCAEGALQIVDGKARLVSEVYCDGLGACLGECPTGALKIIEREAEDFDVAEVEKYLHEKEKEATAQPAQVPCACPSSRIETFASPCEQANRPVSYGAQVPALSHWPVQIRLVPPTAPFLRDASLVVAADCAPVAYPNFQDLIRDKVVMIGCPKFDDVQEYVHKFAEIFSSNNIRSVTVVDMEVPCCSRLPLIVKKGLELAGREIPVEEIVIGVRGGILKQEALAAR
jgi:ferredoxin